MASIKIGGATRNLYASSGPPSEGVPTNNQGGTKMGQDHVFGGIRRNVSSLPLSKSDYMFSLHIEGGLIISNGTSKQSFLYRYLTDRCYQSSTRIQKHCERSTCPVPAQNN